MNNQLVKLSDAQIAEVIDSQLPSNPVGSDVFILRDQSGYLIFTGLLCLLIWLTKSK